MTCSAPTSFAAGRRQDRPGYRSKDGRVRHLWFSSADAAVVLPPRTWAISAARLSAIDITGFSMLRSRDQACRAPNAAPAPFGVVMRWKAIMKSFALASSDTSCIQRAPCRLAAQPR